jgi:hypothetical protein
MSSPGNSGNMGHHLPPRSSQLSPQASPLRTEFRVQQGQPVVRRAAGEKMNRDGITLGDAKRKADVIDKLLDEMGDSSSDEEIPLVLNYKSPRRVAAGRV